MTTRDFNFIVGPEQSTLPTASTPTNDEDTLNKGWLEEHGFCRDAIHCGVANLTALKAITAAVRQDKQIVNVQNVGLYEFDSTDTQTDDGDTIIQPDAGSGRWLKLTAGVGGGGGSQFKFICGEAIDGSSKSKMIALKQENILSLTATNSWIDINEGGGEVSVQILSIDSLYRIYDLGQTSASPGEHDYDLCEEIKDKLNGAGGLALTYDCSYSTSTRLITISASGAFTILLKSGTHGSDNADNNLLQYIGYDDSSDTGSATSHPADDAIEEATAYTTELLGYKTDADYIVKSRNYMGGVEDANNKLAEATGKINTDLSGFTSEVNGSKQYTESAAITITAGVNDDIDFKEGAGAEKNVTLTAGEYLKGSDSNPVKYSELCGEIKTQLESLGAETYTVTFDNNENKFTISATGAFTLLWGTGVNSATNAAETLGWADSDTSSGTSHTSTSAVDHAGEIGEAGTARVKADSVYTGFITSDDKMFAKHSDLSVYDEVYKTPGDWAASPSEKDFSSGSNGIQLHDADYSSNGYGLKLVLDNNSGSKSLYKIRYKTPNGIWQNATSIIDYSTPGNVQATDNFYGGSYFHRSRCAVDENGHGVLALAIYNTTTSLYEVWEYHSTDLDSWSGSLIQQAGVSVYVGGLAIRENKAVKS